MPSKIKLVGPAEVRNHLRYMQDDRFHRGQRLRFLQIDGSQAILIKTEEETPFYLHPHGKEGINNIIENLHEIIGFELPEDFYADCTLYNLGAIVMLRGSETPIRVVNSAILLGGSMWPHSREVTESLVMHGIGNALWNFLNQRAWRGDKDRKNEYRRIRGYPYDPDDRKRKPALRFQAGLFHVAAEDFRYLFGTATSGRGEWRLDVSQSPIPPPNPETVSFWKQEVAAYKAR